MADKHTIILIQYTASYQSRSYIDFPSIPTALDAVVKMYEHKLKELNPNVQHITYDISDLNNYIDSLHDVCGLIFDPTTRKYDPKDRSWIKEKVFKHLRRQA
eukprot:gene8180-16822_t